MATLKPCVQKMRTDGYYPVYIRVTHGRKVGYIKTDKMVHKKDVSKSKDIRDNYVLKYCTELIQEYTQRLNLSPIDDWDVKEIVEFLQTQEDDVSFSDYAQRHIAKLINTGHERTAKNYKLAVAHLERYIGSNRVRFSQLSSVVLKRWIGTLELTNRAKEMYPVCVRQIFKAALLDYNDEERGVIRIKFNPWLKVHIPKSDRAEQRAISAEACREFFNRPLPQTKMLCNKQILLPQFSAVLIPYPKKDENDGEEIKPDGKESESVPKQVPGPNPSMVAEPSTNYSQHFNETLVTTNRPRAYPKL